MKQSQYVNEFDKALQLKAREIERQADEVGYPLDKDIDWLVANQLPVEMQYGEVTSSWGVWATIAIKFGQVLERVQTYNKK